MKGTLGNLRHSTIGRMPDDRNLLCLDTSLAISTCVLHFEVFGSRPRSTPVRLVLLAGQTGPHWSDRPSAIAVHASVFGLGFVAQPSDPVVLW
jgi:hypothetical protein